MLTKKSGLSIVETTEESQALARFVLVTVIALYIGGVALFTEQPPEIVRIAITTTIFSPLAGLWWFFVRRDQRSRQQVLWRIYAGIFADTTMIAITIEIGGFNALPLYIMYLWVIMGNGMRFGTNEMATATAASILSLTITAIVSPHWPLPALPTAVLVLGLLIVDGFYRRILKERDAANETVARLLQDLRDAQLDTSEAGLLGKDTFLRNVQEQMEDLSAGSFLAAIVIGFTGKDAPRVGNPLSDIAQSLSQRITSELRGSDLATLGSENELWMLISPKRMSDASAVAERIRTAFKDIAPALDVTVGIAAYPMTVTDPEGLFALARQNGARDGKPGTRRHRHLASVDPIES